jgi:shikimate dehydrogenase
MPVRLSGATRLVPIVGDPIAQVRSPASVTAAFAARGMDIACVPMHVAPADLAGFLTTIRILRNCAGLIVTVPHKLAAYAACDTTTERARLLQTVNTIRRDADGRLHGDMLDGLGFVAACRAKGGTFENQRALLVGAGGAGTAMAHAVASAGVSHLAIADMDAARRDALVARMAGLGLPVAAADPDPRGWDIVLNATPLGMRAGDALPVAAHLLRPGMLVGDVVTEPDPTPLVAAARAAGCVVSTGRDMFEQVRDLMVDFLLT